MDGIINSNIVKEGASEAPEMGAEPAPTEEGQASGGQEGYERVVTAAFEILYSDETNPNIMKMLETGATDPGNAAFEIAKLILTQLDDQSGGKIPLGVILHAADEISEQAGVLGEKAGYFEYGEKEHSLAMQRAFAYMKDTYEISDEEIQEFMASFSQEEIDAAQAEQSQYHDEPAPADPGQAAGDI